MITLDYQKHPFKCGLVKKWSQKSAFANNGNCAFNTNKLKFNEDLAGCEDIDFSKSNE